MSDTIELYPILNRLSSTSKVPASLRFDPSADGGEALVFAEAERLELVSVREASEQSRRVVATFQQLTPSGPTASFVVVPSVPGLLVDGHQVWGPKVLRPGSTLSLHGCQWLLARRFTPERRPVSADIAELRCSVCGMELRRGKEVSPCQCGALYHFERAVEGKDNGDLLDCYAEAKVCHSCKQEISLETRLLPDPKSLGF